MDSTTRAGITRRWVMGAMLAGVAMPALARAPKQSQRPKPRSVPPAAGQVSAADLAAAANLGGVTSYLVVDGMSGKVLEGANVDAAQAPGSVAKTVTTLYALETLGAGYRFTTELVATGPVTDGVLQGDLVLRGGGDPTLVTDTLGDMAASLKAAGVRSVRGRFLVDASALPRIEAIDPDQPDQVDYNPGLCGLNLNFNRVFFGWARSSGGYSVAMDARGDRFVPQVSLAEMTVVDRDSPLFTYAQRGGVERWTVAGQALGRGGSRWLPVRQPALYAGDVFRVLARAQGIGLPAAESAAVSGGTVLVSHQSDDLRSILKELLKYSTNVTAEVIGLTASVARGGPVASLEASAARMSSWAQARFGISATFDDHSGLGPQTRISAADMVKVLRAAGLSGELRAILKDIMLRDERGRVLKDSAIKVQAKTGTLNFVSGLAGYETTPSGRDLVFAIFAGDMARRDAIPREERERPEGGTAWLGRAHGLEQGLIARWAAVYDRA